MIDLVQQIKEYNIRDIIYTESGIEVLKKNTQCPVCGGGVQSGCFSVGNANLYKCFSCGVGGSAIDFIKDLHHTTPKEAINYIANKYLNIITGEKVNYKTFSKKVIKAAPTENKQTTINDKEVNNKFVDIVKSLQTTVNSKEYQYLLNRGFDEVTCKTYGFYWFDAKNYAEISKLLLEAFEVERLVKSGIFSEKEKLRFYKHRILIAYKHGGDVQHLQARSLPEETDKMKYLFSGGKRTIFNAQNLKEITKETKYIYLCEGAFDAVSVELLKQQENEIIKAVALGSVNGNSKIIDYIIEYCTKENKTPVFAFDNDKAGIQAKEKVNISVLAEKIRKAGLLITTETPTAKDFNIDLQNSLNSPQKQIDKNIYNVGTDVYISCLDWLKTLKNYTSYSFDLKHKEALNFLSEFDNCKFRFIAGNKIVTLKIN